MTDDGARLTEHELLAKVGHELRTPMHGILGLAELLLDSGLSSEQRRSVELIQISAQSLLTLTNDLLDYSRLATDRIVLDDIPFDLVGLVDSTVRLLGVRAFERGIELSYEVAADVPKVVRGDPSRLRQILVNLVGNAVKFTHDGGVYIIVQAEDGDAGQIRIRCTVRDTGIGIPADKLDAIFDEYAQVDVSTSRRYGGAGLGLAIARRLARLMQGDVEVTSELGRGSEFLLTVSLTPETAHAAPSADAAHVPLAGARALVLDESPGTRSLVSQALAAVGIAVDEAAQVDTGLAMLREATRDGRPYRVLILDTWISRQDGYGVARAIREDPAVADLEIMMLTGAGRRGDGRRCRESGIQGYLTKPVAGEELIRAVTTMLRVVESGMPTDALITRHSLAENRRQLAVLLAEDNPVSQQVAATILRKRGHRVDVVETGRAAVEAAAQRSYDVVLMDIEMPDMGGIDATAAIRAMPLNQDLHIIALTAHADDGELKRFRAAGMDACLTKPFKPQDLVQLVEWAPLAPPVAPLPGAPAPAAPVDLADFRRALREAGIEETVGTILGVFREDAPERMDALESAVASGDPEEIRQAAHAFKSAASTVRAVDLAELLGQAEAAGEQGDLVQATELTALVRAEHEAVMAFLEESLAA